MGAAARAAGIAELVGRLGGEIAELVQEVHAASSPVARLRGQARPAEHVYRWVRLGFGAAARASAFAGHVLADEDDGWLDVQSALGGVCGDRLAQEASPLALPMQLLRPFPVRRARRLVVFVHGLCTSERAWQAPAHQCFVRALGAHPGTEVAYLRFNSGRRISQNGAQLAELLEGHVGAGELRLIGHSLGGLLAVSAVHQARARGLEWPARLAGVACLGSPFEGAALERIGNHANRLLGISAWTRPFMRLGNLRSDGIRDLRFGHLLEGDWRGREPDAPEPARSRASLTPGIPHLLVAATHSPAGATRPRGDGLVSTASAHARSLHPPAVAERVQIEELGHLGLLRDARVYAVLRRWLEDPASPARAPRASARASSRSPRGREPASPSRPGLRAQSARRSARARARPPAPASGSSAAAARRRRSRRARLRARGRPRAARASRPA